MEGKAREGFKFMKQSQVPQLNVEDTIFMGKESKRV